MDWSRLNGSVRSDVLIAWLVVLTGLDRIEPVGWKRNELFWFVSTKPPSHLPTSSTATSKEASTPADILCASQDISSV